MDGKLLPMGNFQEWLQGQLRDRGWKQAELARRANVTDATLSRIMSGSRQAGPDVGVSIARALQMDPVVVFRQAGLLPSLPPAVEEEAEVTTIIRELPGSVRRTVLTMLRSLGSRPAYNVAESRASYDAQMTPLERRLLEEFRRLDPAWQEIALEEVERVERMQIRIIGEEEGDEAQEAQGEAA